MKNLNIIFNQLIRVCHFFHNFTLNKSTIKLNAGKISKEAVFEIQVELANGEKIDFSKYELMSERDLEKEIKKIVLENKGAPFNALIGKVMEKLRGKADGKKIVEILKNNKS